MVRCVGLALSIASWTLLDHLAGTADSYFRSGIKSSKLILTRVLHVL